MGEQVTLGPLVLVLSWPGTALSPNSRVHWRRLAAAKKSARRLAWAEALEQRAPEKFTARFAKDSQLTLDMTFHPPDRRSYDRDNLVARMKAPIDGLADALCIDDGCFVETAQRVAEPIKGGLVRMVIRLCSELTNGQ